MYIQEMWHCKGADCIEKRYFSGGVGIWEGKVAQLFPDGDQLTMECTWPGNWAYTYDCTLLHCWTKFNHAYKIAHCIYGNIEAHQLSWEFLDKASISTSIPLFSAYPTPQCTYIADLNIPLRHDILCISRLFPCCPESPLRLLYSA